MIQNDPYLLDYEQEAQDFAQERQDFVNEVLALLLLLRKKNVTTLRESQPYLVQLNQLAKKYNDSAKTWMNTHLSNIAKDGVVAGLVSMGKADRPSSLEELIKAREQVRLKKNSQVILRSSIQEMYNQVVDTTDSVIRRARQAIHQTIADTLTNTSDNPLTRFSNIDQAIVDARGRVWSMHDYSIMLARTVMMKVNQQATTLAGIDNGTGLAIISIAPNTTDACKYFQGTVIKLSEDTPGDYPTFEELQSAKLVFHPNCRHRALPINGLDALTAEQRAYQNEQKETIDFVLSSGSRDAHYIDKLLFAEKLKNK
jgi:hypothetical protein